MQCKADLKY